MDRDILLRKPLRVVIPLLLLLTIFGIMVIKSLWNASENEHTQAAIKTAKIAASSLHGEMLKQLHAVTEDTGTTAYKSIKKRLLNIRATLSNARFVYLFTKREEKIYFIADSEPENSKDYSFPGQEYFEVDQNLLKLYDTGKELVTEPFTDKWGTWKSILISIKDDSTGRTAAIFGIDYDLKKWRSSIIFDVLEASVVVIGLFLLLLVLSLKIVLQNKKLKKDITQQKLAEAKLKESEEKFRSLSEESPNMIFINNAGRVIYVNKKCEEVLGYSRAEFLDAKFNFLDLIAPEYVDTVKKNFADRYSGFAKDSYEYALVTKDKKRIETSISSKIITYEGNKVILGIVTDLTEQKCSELVITKQNKQLKELNATKDKFFSIIAHDLRSPLQGFLGMTQLMSEEVGEFSPAELSKFAREMNTSAQNLFKLLQNLLDWARLQNGTIDFTPGECSLKEIVDQNIETIEQRATQKGITILNEITEYRMIFADEKMINTVFRNLLSNAVKFSRKDDRITINAHMTIDGMIKITVHDTGVGISGENLTKLFKLNEKVRSRGTEGEPSTGLGLLLCKEFIEKNGGKIWVESEEEKGSTFYFTVPAKEIMPNGKSIS